MSYTLTAEGAGKVKSFLADLSEKRKEILDAGLDTADNTFLPSEDDILNDIESDELEDFGDGPEYLNSWGCTDNYDSDLPLSLVRGIDFNLNLEESPTR